MTLKEAAERLGVSPQTLGVQVRKGKLIADRHGRDWWVADAEVERYRRESLGRRRGGRS